MGYRSEVAYVLRFKDKEMRESFVNLQRAKADEYINRALDELIELEDNMLAYHAEYVKWYEDFPEVKAHHCLMADTRDLFGDRYSSDYNDQAGYKFIRLGEESDDNEDEEGGNSECLYEYLSWTKSIVTSFERDTYAVNQTKEGETI